jgi:hypothetical protein
MKRILLPTLAAFAIFSLPILSAQTSTAPEMATSLEKHLRKVHQLTFGGQNAEAYFSADGKKLIYQSSHGDVKCDQIFIMNIDGTDQHMVSTGKGRTTCSFFYPDVHASGEPRVPASSGFLEGLRVGRVFRI